MNITEKLLALAPAADKTYWSRRICAELRYAAGVSDSLNGKYEREVDACAESLLEALKAEGVITDGAAKFAEKLLAPTYGDCRALTLYCIGHAHIDMNWMWGFHETVGVAIETFRTVLKIMDEFPGFTFAQSQASVYRVIEQYAPWLLPEIRDRVADGTWEVTASTWVETDKNMPSGESLSRHILNTKKYLSGLLPLKPEQLCLDFEPDTFGHSANVPEICNAGGVKYYYHCRGNGDENIYRWRAPSGAELLVYRELDWYNGEINERMAERLPGFASHYGVDCGIKVFGVGDHGGGPTRRDAERIVDMMSWPAMPEIRFGTFREFFDRLAKRQEKFPVLTGEQNFLFTGCYTSQSRIKTANRVAEDRLFDSEMLAAAARLKGGEDFADSFSSAWEGVLFNCFHDILPGSGTVETRECAMGTFQRSLAAANANASRAMSVLASQLDTSAFAPDGSGGTVSEGAGVGYAADQGAHFGFPRAERGRGKTRVYALFNTTRYGRSGPVELTLWDWPGDRAALRAKNSAGEDVPCEITGSGDYWAHKFLTLRVQAEVPALGYAVYGIYEGARTIPAYSPKANDRLDYITMDAPALENSLIRAVFDRETMRLISLTDKRTGAELVSEPSCRFEHILEDTVNGMTSWRVGNYMKVTDINASYPVRSREVRGGLVKSISYDVKFLSSSLEVTVRLAENSPTLEFAVKCDWHELGSRSETPQLRFCVPFGYAAAEFENDIPMGLIKRPALGHDVPCRSFSAAVNPHGASLLLTSDSKYGFRNSERALALTLIRSSSDPDPYPEFGIHDMRLGVAVAPNTAPDTLTELAAFFAHPVFACSVPSGEGKLPPVGSLCTVSGENVALSCVKTPENGEDGFVIRLYNLSAEPTVAALTFPARPKAIYRCDTAEISRVPIITSEKGLALTLRPAGVLTLRIVL